MMKRQKGQYFCKPRVYAISTIAMWFLMSESETGKRLFWTNGSIRRFLACKITRSSFAMRSSTACWDKSMMSAAAWWLLSDALIHWLPLMFAILLYRSSTPRINSTCLKLQFLVPIIWISSELWAWNEKTMTQFWWEKKIHNTTGTHCFCCFWSLETYRW